MLLGILLFFTVIILSMSLGEKVYKIRTAQEAQKVEKEQTCNEVNGKEHVYKDQCLPEGYEPELLLLSPRATYLTTTQQLSVRGKIMVEQMITDAEKDGMCLVVISGYRSFEDQKKLYNRTTEKEITAIAGGSEHQTGLAVDLGACPMFKGVRNDAIDRPELSKNFEELPEYEWMTKNANKYGFVQSFREENKQETGYPAESWHWKLIVN